MSRMTFIFYVANQVEYRLAKGLLKLRNLQLKKEIISSIGGRAGTMAVSSLELGTIVLLTLYACKEVSLGHDLT